MLDLHRHDQFSRFDGFGRPLELAKLAKELGYTALGTANHGNTNGLIQTHDACKRVGIKPVLGCEGYFLPKHKSQDRGYHLCLFAKNLQGYKNLNTIQYEGEKQKYYNPIWDFKMLEEYSEGLICTSACVGSYLGQAIWNDNDKAARKYIEKSLEIFDEDFYLEVQPYVVSDPGMQEKINVGKIKYAEEYGIRCILTSDSHMGDPSDLDTYMKMHEIGGADLDWVEGTYADRYMPRKNEMEKRFVKMHAKDFGKKRAIEMAKEMRDNLNHLESTVEGDILGQLELQLPQIDDSGEDNWKAIVRQVKEGLKRRGRYTEECIQRCKEELSVIKANGFIDYFLIVADYTNYAKNNGIAVGPGRGSVCNCMVAYAMYITEVDSIALNLDFRRFMRLDKKAWPDIDLDFEMDRRQEVIDYIIEKYEGQCARVSSYGLYKVDNTINDLAKVCGLLTDKNVDSSEAKNNKTIIASMKQIIRRYIAEDGSIDEDGLFNGENAADVQRYNKQYDNIMNHFAKLFDKVRFIGTHAAGVVITSGDVLQYTALRMDKTGSLYSGYNLEDLEYANIIKFDVLGLKTMQSLSDCRRYIGVNEFDFAKHEHDPKLYDAFRNGETTGIFQLEKNAAKRILAEIQCSNFNDVVATIAMNRPGPLGQKMPEQYAANKLHGMVDTDSIEYQYTEESYGTVVYQEQLLMICVYIGGLEWWEADLVLKANKHGFKEKAIAILNKHKADTGVDLYKKFVTNAVKNGMEKERAIGAWNSLLVYSFNKGHAAGYGIISLEEMYYKVYHPTLFWYTKIKYARDDKEKAMFSIEAVKGGNIIFLTHVNYSLPNTSIRTTEGEDILQQGFLDVKGIGAKAAEFIYNERMKNGVFTSRDNFLDRCAGRNCNTKIQRLLDEQGALEFDKQTYIKRVTLYNSALHSRAQR